MANHKEIIPFIKKWEGGYINDPLDKGGETQQGITYNTWKSVFGGNDHPRFIKMTEDDWALIYQKLFWNAIQGDKINSQRIANLLADWAWGSGDFWPKKRTQNVLNTLGFKLKTDSIFGNGTLSAINKADEQKLYDAIIVERWAWLEQIYKAHPEQRRFEKGWANRLNNLIQFNLKNKIA